MKLLYLPLTALCLLLCLYSLKAATSPGLAYNYYKGQWTTIPNFSTLTPVKSGYTSNINLGVRNDTSYYAIQWSGLIKIPTAGTYTFETRSGDGSKLVIGGTTVVNNDGIHSITTVSNTISLQAGSYPINISFLQGTNSGLMEVYWSCSSASISRARIPDSAFISLQPEVLNNRMPGLNFSYYEGEWNELPDFNSLIPFKKGFSSIVDNQPIRNPVDTVNYAILWQGYITIPANGTYTFETVSDDGSKLYIGEYSFTGKPLVQNDSLHGAQTRTGALYLSKGVYPIAVSFFQGSLDDNIDVFWSSTDASISRQEIPSSAFSHLSSPLSNRIAGLNYKYYEGTYTSLPDFSSLTPKKTGSYYYADPGIRDRDTDYAILWDGFITIPTDGTYTFETISDDGSKVYIETNPGQPTLVVDNDFVHSPQQVTGSIYLTAGVYPFKIAYFNYRGSGLLTVWWTSNTGIERQTIPNEILSRVESTEESGGMVGSAINYYFSNSGSDAGAGTIASPWASIDKLNLAMATAPAGTGFLLKRGDTFNGSIIVNKSGTSVSPIIISAYGSGPKPVITGFDSSPSWSPLGDNKRWETSVNSSIEYLNLVARDGQILGKGRFPNATAPNKGYLTYSGHTDTTKIVGSGQALQNWDSAQVVIRKNEWVIDKGKILHHNLGNNEITYDPPTRFEPNNGYGYFIQNHPGTLDVMGEWYFDSLHHKIQVFSGRSSPATYGIKVSKFDTLVAIMGHEHITLDNLSLQGANQYAIYMVYGSNYTTVQNCTIDLTGVNGIETNNSRHLLIHNNTVNHTNNTGLYLAGGCDSSIILNNLIKNTGLIAGMGKNNNQSLEGMTIGGTGSIIKRNVVDSTGYIGIAFVNGGVTAVNNFVNHFALTTDDGAGIYTDGDHTGSKILNNVVQNGKGSHEGTFYTEDRFANGIGLDDNSTNVEISGNSIANCNGQGIGLHNAQGIRITGNTVFNNKTAQLELDHDRTPAGYTDNHYAFRSMTIHDNIFFAKTISQDLYIQNTLADDVNVLGNVDSLKNNYYAKPINDSIVFTTIIRDSSTNNPLFTQTYDLAHWQSIFGYDANSHTIPGKLRIPSYVVNAVGANSYTNSSFTSGINNVLTPSSSVLTLSYDNTTNALGSGPSLKTVYQQGNIPGGTSVWFYNQGGPNPTAQAGHTYRVRFSIKGNLDGNTDFTVRFNSASDSVQSDITAFKVYNTTRNIELLITPTKDIPSSYLVLSTEQPAKSPTYWVDNVTIEEVQLITYTNPDDYIRYEYNGDSLPKTVSLDAIYTDVTGTNTYTSSVPLDPYSSIILIKANVLPISQLAGAKPLIEAMKATAEINTLGLRLSPNPASNYLILTYPIQSVSRQSAILTISNSSGAVVKTLALTLTGQPINLDVAGLSAGVYNATIISGGKSSIIRFVKL